MAHHGDQRRAPGFQEAEERAMHLEAHAIFFVLPQQAIQQRPLARGMRLRAVQAEPGPPCCGLTLQYPLEQHYHLFGNHGFMLVVDPSMIVSLPTALTFASCVSSSAAVRT